MGDYDSTAVDRLNSVKLLWCKYLVFRRRQLLAKRATVARYQRRPEHADRQENSHQSTVLPLGRAVV